MEIFWSVIQLLAGLGAFLLGFKLLSDNIEKLATNKLRGWFDKTSKSRLAGVGIGAGVTAIIQSSSATTVMVVGFVNAGIMSLYSATAIIMGANIGTTITAHIASLSDINVIGFVTVLTCAGIFMDMLSKNDRVKTVGIMLAGLGLVFLGLEYMSDAMSIYRDNAAFKQFLQTISNPFLLLLIGAGFTALVQSSSAVTSLIIVIVNVPGAVIGNGGNDVLFLVLGSNIGTCITAILSSLGANANAKRASLIHLMFNVFGSVIFTVFLLCWPSFMDMTLAKWFSSPGRQIAMFHTFFNVVCTCLFLPFTNVFVKISTKLIRDKKEGTGAVSDSALLDERFIQSPSVAIGQANKETAFMAGLAMESLDAAFNGFVASDESAREKVEELNARVAELEKNIVGYLIRISSQDVSAADERIISAIHQATGDILRISELAENITKYTRNSKRDGVEFSPGVLKSLRQMYEKITRLYECALEVFDSKDISELKTVDAVEEEIDAARKEMINDHIRRLNEGKCKPQSSGIFINLVGNLERAADHLTYVAHAFD
ncbi:MAG TPA: Na/Pi cotransporter family protein [Candidatus Borkfalkia excrementavium]|uniref:Na/Pi cotransporter family protein n=1 Tax=Candidatus Borkfalkia excrementavium TaxID=2838505 RepID=A0A9D1Z6E1_9FIRM|nr:Na/Pi cotransporter family protein [Candidatus Borkfalkia excrementavium]